MAPLQPQFANCILPEFRYFVPDSVPLPEETKRTLQLKVVNFLKKWIIERAHDFNESLLRYVHEFTEMMKEEGQAGLAQQIEIALQKLKQDVQQRNEQLTHAANGLFLKMKNIGTLFVFHFILMFTFTMIRSCNF